MSTAHRSARQLTSAQSAFCEHCSNCFRMSLDLSILMRHLTLSIQSNYRDEEAESVIALACTLSRLIYNRCCISGVLFHLLSPLNPPHESIRQLRATSPRMRASPRMSNPRSSARFVLLGAGQPQWRRVAMCSVGTALRRGVLPRYALALPSFRVISHHLISHMHSTTALCVGTSRLLRPWCASTTCTTKSDIFHFLLS
jgi:hypothetical protein